MECICGSLSYHTEISKESEPEIKQNTNEDVNKLVGCYLYMVSEDSLIDLILDSTYVFPDHDIAVV